MSLSAAEPEQGNRFTHFTAGAAHDRSAAEQ